VSAIVDHGRFLRSFVTDPRSVGAIAPSTCALARVITAAARVSRGTTIVELGGGTGSFTRVIVEEAPCDATIISIEINPTFADLLASRFGRVHVIEGSAERMREFLDACGCRFADCVVSGLPWAAFRDDLQSRILEKIHAVLRPGGIFATFAYAHAAWWPSAKRFRCRLHELFAEVALSPVVWRNIPPAFVYACVR
jgi:phospholipid N-methyltransferase